jgi:hypothetical protein
MVGSWRPQLIILFQCTYVTFENMFNWFKSKSSIEKLEALYRKKLQEAFDLSKVNRKASDLKTAEAEAIAKQIEVLKTGK